MRVFSGTAEPDPWLEFDVYESGVDAVGDWEKIVSNGSVYTA
jgi:hypothetical protein